VFVTTHYMDEAEYCNRLVLIDRGRIVAMGTPTELKRQSMKGELLLVECEPLGSGLAALRETPGVTEAAVFGRALHALVADARSAVEPVRAALLAHQVDVRRVEPIQPSLEDVFVALTAGRTGRPEVRA
jgi:ABC-2 type transport system ATP-binding protein